MRTRSSVAPESGEPATPPAPRATTSRVKLEEEALPAPVSIILNLGDRTVLVPRPPTLSDAITQARSLFLPSPCPEDDVYLSTTVGPMNMLCEVVDASWNASGIVDEYRVFVVKTRAGAGRRVQDQVVTPEGVAAKRQQVHSSHGKEVATYAAKKARQSLSEPPIAATPPGQRTITIRWQTVDGRSDLRSDLRIKAFWITSVQSIYDAVELATGYSYIALYLDGYRVSSVLTVGQTFKGWEDEDEELYLDCRFEQRGGKPVIYLFPPSPLDTVAVSLDLVLEWTFSALYPLVPINSSKLIKGGTSVKWIVSASPSGQLVEKESSLALSYLFWEAHAPQLALNTCLLSLPSSPTLTAPSFNPGLASLLPHDSIALPLPLLLPYLDTVLASLTLHTSARNDFITYWLDSFARLQARGQHIAIRFLPQAEYEQAAVLKVEPKPDVVTRVFMLFKGVDEDQASEYTEVGDVDWREVVGVKNEATDEKLFRVLEWGGMEVATL